MDHQLIKETEEALQRYFSAIKPPPESNTSALLEAIKGLNELTRLQAPKMEPELRHFMQRQSYEKALQHVKLLQQNPA